jgi:hypothetical protein
MNPTVLAFGLYAFAVCVLAAAWFLTDADLLRRNEDVTGLSTSHGCRFANFARDPVLAVKSLPSDFAAIHEARNTPSPDPILETRRKRANRLFVATAAVVFGGLPLSLFIVGVLARLHRFMSLSLWTHALIIAVWLAILIAIGRRSDRSRLALLLVMLGLATSILFAVFASLDQASRGS